MEGTSSLTSESLDLAAAASRSRASAAALRHPHQHRPGFLKVRKEKLPDCFTGLNNLVYLGDK